MSIRNCHSAVQVMAALLGGRRTGKREWGPEEKANWRRIQRWPWRENIIGIAAGAKWAAGNPTGELAIKFYVLRKVGESRLDLAQRIPERFTIPGFPRLRFLRDVQPISGIPVAHGPTSLAPGSELAHFAGTKGTLGLVVRRDTGPVLPLTLSCSHVLARSGRARAQDSVESPVDANSSIAFHRVGSLLKFTELRQDSDNPVDGALASIDPAGASFRAEIPGIGRPSAIRRLLTSELREDSPVLVTRVGAVTGIQHGRIQGALGTFLVNELPGLTGAVRIGNLVPYSTPARAQKGDSGAVILEKGTTRVIGIHIAGNDSHGLLQIAPPVLQALGVRLWDGA
ncbi:MAG: hypothetical protein SFV51_14270 [Bryobacteraceae bacterium]|nr:hypothetical protein [Bryobacteraceae bacterium]